MKKRIIKLVIIIIFVLIIFPFKEKVNASYIDFKFIIDTIGIPEYNVKGEKINEFIYYTYNVFVYSDPISIKNKSYLQRFKEVKDKGKFTQNGVKGEYYILGTDYNGDFVYNVYFPVDEVPLSLPDSWIFLSSNENLASWNDNMKYKYEEQLYYMKTSRLLFDRIDIKNHTADSYDLVEYNISPIKNGLDKFKLNTSATWKTMGIVTAKRYVNGKTMDAIFAASPMCASADIVSTVLTQDSLVIGEEDDEVDLNITFGCKAVNLNEYAKVEHIKGIKSIIYINGKEVDAISSTKTDSLSKEISYTVSREDENKKEFPLKISIFSFLYTEFAEDGILQNTVEKEVTIYQEEKLINAVESIDAGMIKKSNEKLYFKPLMLTSVCRDYNSVGIAPKGINMCLRLLLNTKNVESVDIYINDIKQDVEILKQDEMYMFVNFKLDVTLKTTIYDVYSLREDTKNYYNIDRTKIGTRKNLPNNMSINVYTKNSRFDYDIKFDTISHYIFNINEELDVDDYNKSQLFEI